MILCANPKAQFDDDQEEIENAVLAVLRSGRYVLGPEVDSLEKEFAKYIGCDHAIGVANGTDALELALRAFDVGLGDEVVTVSHTAVATVAAIEAVGATPVLVDVDDQYFTMDANQLSEVISKRTKAVVLVHIYGQPADINAVKAICDENNLVLVEDVSQAHGAKWNAKRVGSFGHVSCFSCYPTKNLGAIGDAGLITVNDESVARKIRMLREYGWKDRYISDFAGRNSRLDEVQAAILRIKLRRLDHSNAKRVKIAEYYNQRLADVVEIPAIRSGVDHVYHLYVVKTERRDRLIRHLNSKEIYPGIHYPLPIHLQPAYKGSLTTHHVMANTEKLASTVLSLPIYPEFSASQNVVDEVLNFFGAG